MFTEEELVWLRNRESFYFSQLRRSYPSEIALEQAKALARQELSALKTGQGDPAVTEQFTKDMNALETRTDIHSVLSRVRENVGSPSGEQVSPMSLASGGFDRGWESPIDMARGMLGGREWSGEGSPPPGYSGVYHKGWTQYTGLPSYGTWSSGNRYVDASLNFLWNFYDTFTLFMGPVQKGIERATGLNIYPDWTQDPQDPVVRTAGAIGGGAGLFGTTLITGGAGLLAKIPVVGAKVAPVAFKAAVAAHKIAFTEKLFGAGRGIATKAIKKGLEKAGYTTTDMVTERISKRIFQTITKYAPSDSDPESFGRFAAWIGKSAAAVSEKTGAMWGKATGKDLSRVVIPMAESVVRNAGLKGAAAEAAKKEISEHLMNQFSVKAVDRLADLAKGRLSGAVLSWADGAIMHGTAMALHGAAVTEANLIAEGVPATYHIPITGKQVMSSYGTGAVFSLFGQIPNLYKVDKEARTLMHRVIGLKDPASKRYLDSVTKMINDEVARGTAKFKTSATGMDPLTTAEAVARRTADRMGVPIDFYDNGPFKPPNFKKLVQDENGWKRVKMMVRMLRKEYSNLDARARKLHEKFTIFSGVTSGEEEFADSMKDRIATELEEIVNLNRKLAIRYGMRESAKQFTTALPRMATAAMVMHGRELFTDFDAFKDHPEDFIVGMMMTAYFTRYPNAPGRYMPNTKNQPRYYADNQYTDVDLAKRMLHVSGMTFPEFFADPRMTNLTRRLAGDAAIFDKDMTDNPSLQAMVELSSQAQVPKEDMEAEAWVREYSPAVDGKYSKERIGEIISEIGKLKAAGKKIPKKLQDDFYNAQAEIGRDKYVSIDDIAETTGPDFLYSETVSYAGEELAGRYLNERGRRLILADIIHYVNSARGFNGKPGEAPLIDDFTWTDQTRWRFYKLLRNRFGTSEVSLESLTKEVEGERIDDNIRTFKMQDDVVSAVYNAFSGEMIGGARRIILNPAVEKKADDELKLAVDTYNSFHEHILFTGGTHLTKETGRKTEQEIAAEKVAGIEGGKEGDPRTNILKIDDMFQLQKLSAVLIGGTYPISETEMSDEFVGAIRIAEKQFGEYIGNPERGHMINNPDVQRMIQGQQVFGGVIWSNMVYNGTIESVPMYDDQGNPYIDSETRTNRLELGMIDTLSVRSRIFVPYKKLPGRYMYVGLPEWKDLPGEAKKSFRSTTQDIALTRVEAEENGRDPGRTTEARWGRIKAWFDNINYVRTNIVATSKYEETMKTEFDSQEMNDLHRIGMYLDTSGLALGERDMKLVRATAIKQKYRNAGPLGLAVLEGFSDLRRFNYETGVLEMPDFVRIVDKNGETVERWSPAEGTYLKFDNSVYQTVEGQKLMDAVKELQRFGVITDVLINKNGLPTRNVLGLEEGTYLNGADAFKYLTAVFRAQGLLHGGRSQAEVLDNIIRRLDLKKNLKGKDGKAIGDILTNELVQYAKSDSGQFYKFLRFLETSGVIGTIDSKTGEYLKFEANRLLTKHVRGSILRFNVDHLIGSEAAAEGIPELLREVIEPNKVRLDAVRQSNRIKFQTFRTRLNLTPDDVSALQEAYKSGTIKDGLDLRNYVEKNIDTSVDPDFVRNLKPQKWQSLLVQLTSARVVSRIRFSHAGDYEVEDGMIKNFVPDVNLVLDKSVLIHGNNLVDRFAADGTEIVLLDTKYDTSQVKRKYGKKGVDGEVIDLFSDAEGAYDKLLEFTSEINKVSPKTGVVKSPGGKVARAKIGGLIVPSGPGGQDRVFFVKIPVFSSYPDSQYVHFYNEIKRLAGIVGTEISQKVEADKNLPQNRVGWDDARAQNLQSLMASRGIHALLDALPAPGSGKWTEGVDLAGAMKTDVLLEGIQVYSTAKLFGDKIFRSMYAADRDVLTLPKDQISEARKEFIKAISKYSHQASNIEAPGVDSQSWALARDYANVPGLGGPKLEGDRVRFAIVDDKDPKLIEQYRHEAFDGMLIISQRLAHALSFSQGYDETTSILKAQLISHGVLESGSAENQFILTKNSMQAPSEMQVMMERYGVDMLIPKSVAKMFTGTTDGALLPEETHSIARAPSKLRTFSAPVRDLRIKAAQDSSAHEAKFHTFLEIGLDSGGVDALAKVYGIENDSDPSVRELIQVANLLRGAREGKPGYVKIANELYRLYYQQSAEQGYEDLEGTFESTHRKWIFSSPTANPMAPDKSTYSLNFVSKRILKQSLFEKHSPHARLLVSRAPSLTQEGLTFEDPSVKNGWVGTAAGSHYDRSLPLSVHTGMGFKNVAGNWIRTKDGLFPTVSTDGFQLVLREGKIPFSADFKTYLESKGVVFDSLGNVSGDESIKKVADLMMGFISGRLGDAPFSDAQMSTEGRFYDLLDWMTAGTAEGPGAQRTLVRSWDYGGKANKRNGLVAGIVGVYSRAPNNKLDGSVVAVKQGLLNENDGNAFILNRLSWHYGSDGDHDYDVATWYNNMPQELIAKWARAAQDLDKRKVKIDTHPDAADFNYEMNSMSLKDWVDLKAHQYRAQKMIGHSTRLAQTYNVLMQKGEYVPLADPNTGRRYWVGPRYRSYEEMRAAGDDLKFQEYISIFTDAAGKKLSNDTMSEEWKFKLYRQMFAVYEDNGKGRPDYTKPSPIDKPHHYAVIEAQMRPYNELSTAVKVDENSMGLDQILAAAKNYSFRTWGRGGDKRSLLAKDINSSIMYSLMRSDDTALMHFLSALGVDKLSIERLTKIRYETAEDKENFNAVKARITKTVNAAGVSLHRENPEYMSLRERVAKRLVSSASLFETGSYDNMNRGEREALDLFVDIAAQIGGLPSNATVNQIATATYNWFEKQEILKESDLKARRVQLEEQNKELIEAGIEGKQLAWVRGQLAGINKYLQNSYKRKAQARRMDKKDKFWYNDRHKNDIDENQVVERFLQHQRNSQVTAAFARGEDPAVIEEIRRDVGFVDAEIRRMWAQALQAPEKGGAKGYLKWSMGQVGEGEYTTLTKDLVSQATDNLAAELVAKWDGRVSSKDASKNLGQLAAMMLLETRSNEIKGWYQVGRGVDQVGQPRTGIPVYRNPRSPVLRHLSAETLELMAKTDSILWSGIWGKNLDSILGMMSTGVETYGDLVGRTDNPWEWGRGSWTNELLSRMVSKKVSFEGGTPREIEGPPNVRDLIGYRPGSTVAVKLTATDVWMGTAERFVDILINQGKLNWVVAQQYLSALAKRENGYIDLTDVDKMNPMKDVASFLIKEYKQSIPREDAEDMRVATKWLRNLSRQPSNTPTFRKAVHGWRYGEGGLGSGGVGGGGLPPAIPSQTPEISGPVGPDGGFQRGVEPRIQSVEEQKLRTDLGRTIQYMLNHPNFKGRYPSVDVKEMDVWVTRVLGKDIAVDRLTEKDLHKIKTSFERLMTGLNRQRFANEHDFMLWIRDKLWTDSALAADDPQIREFAYETQFQAYQQAVMEKKVSNRLRSVTKALSNVFNIAQTERSYLKMSERAGKLEQEQKRIASKMTRLQQQYKGSGKDIKSDQEYVKLENRYMEIGSELGAMRYGDEEATKITRINDDVIELVQSIKSVEGSPQASTVVWMPERKEVIDRILFEKPYANEMITAAREIHVMLREIYPVLVEGYNNYKQLIAYKGAERGVPEHILKAIEERMTLGEIEGYFPRFHPQFLADIVFGLDAGALSGDMTILGSMLEAHPMPTGAIKSRGFSEDWSRNILVSLTRYADSARLFAYKNAVELQAVKAINEIARIVEHPNFDKARFGTYTDSVIKWIETWRGDVLYRGGESMLDRALKYTRGAQLISKLGFRVSTAIRNVTQIVSGYAAVGIGETREAMRWARTEEGLRVLAHIAPVGGISSVEGEMVSERMRRYNAGDEVRAKVDDWFGRMVGKMLIPLQSTPFLGEKDARQKVRIAVVHRKYMEMQQNLGWKESFRTRKFTEAQLKAFPWLGSLQAENQFGKTISDKDWSNVWLSQYERFSIAMADREASEWVSRIHFSYDVGSKSPLLRTPLGALLFQLKHFTIKNTEMWMDFVDNAFAAGRAKAEDPGTGGTGMKDFLKTPEGHSLFWLGMFTIAAAGAKTVIPFGVANMFRSDWQDILSQVGDMSGALSDDDEKKINRLFYGKGLPHMFFGPAVGDLTTMLNIGFSDWIGDPNNAVKLLAGFRDMRDLDDAKMFHKTLRAVGPSVVADFMYYDAPQMVRTNMRSLPESVFSMLGFRYRYDEGQLSEKAGDWIMQEYEKRTVRKSMSSKYR